MQVRGREIQSKCSWKKPASPLQGLRGEALPLIICCPGTDIPTSLCLCIHKTWAAAPVCMNTGVRARAHHTHHPVWGGFSSLNLMMVKASPMECAAFHLVLLAHCCLFYFLFGFQPSGLSKPSPPGGRREGRLHLRLCPQDAKKPEYVQKLTFSWTSQLFIWFGGFRKSGLWFGPSVSRVVGGRKLKLWTVFTFKVYKVNYRCQAPHTPLKRGKGEVFFHSLFPTSFCPHPYHSLPGSSLIFQLASCWHPSPDSSLSP